MAARANPAWSQGVFAVGGAKTQGQVSVGKEKVMALMNDCEFQELVAEYGRLSMVFDHVLLQEWKNIWPWKRKALRIAVNKSWEEKLQYGERIVMAYRAALDAAEGGEK